MKKLLGWLHSLPDWLRAAYRTAYMTAIGTFGISLLGWFADIQTWAGDTSTDFPSVSPLGKAAVAALAGIGAGVVSAIINKVGSKGASYPPPSS